MSARGEVCSLVAGVGGISALSVGGGGSFFSSAFVGRATKDKQRKSKKGRVEVVRCKNTAFLSVDRGVCDGFVLGLTIVGGGCS